MMKPFGRIGAEFVSSGKNDLKLEAWIWPILEPLLPVEQERYKMYPLVKEKSNAE